MVTMKQRAIKSVSYILKFRELIWFADEMFDTVESWSFIIWSTGVSRDSNQCPSERWRGMGCLLYQPNSNYNNPHPCHNKYIIEVVEMFNVRFKRVEEFVGLFVSFV